MVTKIVILGGRRRGNGLRGRKGRLSFVSFQVLGKCGKKSGERLQEDAKGPRRCGAAGAVQCSSVSQTSRQRLPSDVST